MVKEIDMYIQEAQRIPTKWMHRGSLPRHIIIKMPQVKDKERILRAARGNKLSTGEFL